jgi:hypothetical protein
MFQFIGTAGKNNGCFFPGNSGHVILVPNSNLVPVNEGSDQNANSQIISLLPHREATHGELNAIPDCSDKAMALPS